MLGLSLERAGGRSAAGRRERSNASHRAVLSQCYRLPKRCLIAKPHLFPDPILFSDRIILTLTIVQACRVAARLTAVHHLIPQYVPFAFNRFAARSEWHGGYLAVRFQTTQTHVFASGF